MTKAEHSAFVTAVIVISTIAAVGVGGPSAAALEPNTAAPFPHSPGANTQDFPVSVVAQRNDAIVSDGMGSVTLDFGADNRFDGSVSNVSADDIGITIVGSQNQRSVGAFEVTRNRNGTVGINFSRRVPIAAGNRILVELSNVTTPSADGTYVVSVAPTTPGGTTDGPVSVDYRVQSASLSFPNQSASQFSDNQSVSLSGVVPNAGYIGVFTVAENGSRDRLVGQTDAIVAKYNTRNYTVPLSGTVNESQRLEAVVFYETTGDSRDARLNASFDPSADAVVTNNGNPANATGYVTTIDADARIAAGSEYASGARLYFDQGQPGTGYQIQAVGNGTLGDVVTQFETPANGSRVIATIGFAPGQYAITRVDDGSVVSLDGDDTTGPQDDSFSIVEATETTTGVANATTDATNTTTTNGSVGTTATTATTAGGTTTGTTAGTGADTDEPTGTATGDDGGNASDGNASAGNDSGGGGNGGDSGAFGPGFGPVVAVIALLAAALVAVRRTR